MTKSFELDINPQWPQKLRGAAKQLLTETARAVHKDMVRYAPVESGRLRNDLDWEVNGLVALVGARSVPYAIYVEEGTRPHSINAKPGGALNWPEADHPSNSVNHPGATATYFMRRALYQKR